MTKALQLRRDNNSGQVKAVSTSATEGLFAVEFYVETLSLPGVKVWDARTGET